MNQLLLKAEKCKVIAWSYEEWIDAILNPDSKDYLNEFYQKTKKWNRIKDKI